MDEHGFNAREAINSRETETPGRGPGLE